jgi:hypothetical protein
LRLEIVGRLAALGLVGGEGRVAEARHRRVEADRDVGRILVRYVTQERIGEAIGRIARRPVVARHRRQGVVGAEDVDVAVEEVDEGILITLLRRHLGPTRSSIAASDARPTPPR